MFLIELMSLFTSVVIIMSSHQTFQWKIVRKKRKKYVTGRGEDSLSAQGSWSPVWLVKFSSERNFSSEEIKRQTMVKYGWPGESSSRCTHTDQLD